MEKLVSDAITTNLAASICTSLCRTRQLCSANGSSSYATGTPPLSQRSRRPALQKQQYLDLSMDTADVKLDPAQNRTSLKKLLRMLILRLGMTHLFTLTSSSRICEEKGSFFKICHVCNRSDRICIVVHTNSPGTNRTLD